MCASRVDRRGRARPRGRERRRRRDAQVRGRDERTRSVHTDPNETTTVFPNSPVYYDIEISSRVIDWRFEAYTKKHFYIAVAARLEYCDGNRSLHWTPRFSLRRTSPCSAAQHRCASTPESPTTPSARTRPRGSRERRPNALTGPHPAGQAPCGPFWRIDRYWMPLHVVADGPDASPRQRRFVAGFGQGLPQGGQRLGQRR